MRTAVIMQPTYLPWMGYFDLMVQADVFVFLDSVQFDKRSWQQRNRIKAPQGELMLTVPVLSKGRFDQNIGEVLIDQTKDFRAAHLKSIQFNYAKAKYFKQYMPALEAIFQKNHALLADLNIDLILWFKENFQLSCEVIRSSQLGIDDQKAQLLVNICQKLGAQRYLSPVGAKDYIKEGEIFRDNGIELLYQNFNHPPYHQLFGQFIPFLSVIDLMFNEGENSLNIIKSGRN